MQFLFLIVHLKSNRNESRLYISTYYSFFYLRLMYENINISTYESDNLDFVKRIDFIKIYLLLFIVKITMFRGYPTNMTLIAINITNVLCVLLLIVGETVLLGSLAL